MIERKTGKEFKDTGLLWFINTTLHLFGWTIVYDAETGVIYPARCKFRGFEVSNNDKGYQKVSKYLLENIEQLEKESRE